MELCSSQDLKVCLPVSWVTRQTCSATYKALARQIETYEGRPWFGRGFGLGSHMDYTMQPLSAPVQDAGRQGGAFGRAAVVRGEEVEEFS